MSEQVTKMYLEHATIRGGITCPFCGEEDFDLIGLKHHLQNYCEPFSETISIAEEALQREKGKE